MKPVLLLDVDGVIAPFGGEHGLNADYHRVDTHNTYIFLRLDLPELMQRLIRHYTLMWGSAWEESANEHLLEYLGLEDPLEFVSFIGDHDHTVGERKLSGIRLEPGYSTWKLPWIKYFLDRDDRPAVWIDDEALDDAQEYAAERTASGKPTLFIRTEPHLGFLDSHVDELETWAIDLKETTNAA